MNYVIPTVGVEEEYQLVDPKDGSLIPNCKQVMQTIRRSGGEEKAHSEIQHELHLNQIEMASEVCESLEQVRDTLNQTRLMLVDAARTNESELAAAGTNPLPVPEDDALTPKDRYQAMTDRYQQIARDLFIFGCHVHVAMDDQDLGIRVMNRCRRWLPILQAITANSPFWNGVDTGYASYRRELWAQWPMAGPPAHFDSLSDYQDCVDQLIRSGAIKDESFLYWDIRLPTRVPTIEFRAADVMTKVEETVGYVGLIRAIVMHAMDAERQAIDFQPIRPSVLSYAIWHSARYGMTEDLVDAESCEKVPAGELLDRTMDVLAPALKATGEAGPVEHFANRLLSDGTGADRQRRGSDLSNIVTQVVAETVPNVIPA
ncbi:glutamate--cysteine ligase 2 [Rhodopirellula halodulae]|uniref:glutamate--cysteine ligase 2 n=1 Tax=Rhodopirellula halodulae TaxID=2894198 RepID=UPI001E485E52|nr:glutamate--cysteine ligase [Rhodopirellula sp. JC737]MCC9658347.1 glutamate--cysteine ligase [Rhodopirellula sp. JC737]